MSAGQNVVFFSSDEEKGESLYGPRTVGVLLVVCSRTRRTTGLEGSEVPRVSDPRGSSTGEKESPVRPGVPRSGCDFTPPRFDLVSTLRLHGRNGPWFVVAGPVGDISRFTPVTTLPRPVLFCVPTSWSRLVSQGSEVFPSTLTTYPLFGRVFVGVRGPRPEDDKDLPSLGPRTLLLPQLPDSDKSGTCRRDNVKVRLSVRDSNDPWVIVLFHEWHTSHSSYVWGNVLS